MPVSFFAKTTAANVWKSVASVSAAGLKRGRGKGTGRARIKDFNRGQEIGVGRKKLTMSGLNSPILSANKLVDLNDVGPDPNYQENLMKNRGDLLTFKSFREHPLERGWSGRRAHGKRIGAPDPFNENEFVGFESTILMLRSILSMTGNLGRTKRMHALVVTGNGKGLAGFSTAIGNDAKTVIRRARNRAGQALVKVPIWDNHTVMHSFFSRYYFTTVFVERRPKGHGIRAHRVIKAICEAFGIKDLYARVEGTTNQINMTKAFFLGLMNQKSYEEMAEEKKLHLVELRDETFQYPNVLASPKSEVLEEHDPRLQENLDFTYYINEGKIKTVQVKPRPPFEDHPLYYKYLDKMDYVKNREHTKLMLAAKYGDKKVLDVFPYFISTADSFNNPKVEEES